MDNKDVNQIRLCDRILSALELCLEQEDLTIAEILTEALEKSMTRGTNEPGFVERRSYPPAFEQAMERLRTLRDKSSDAA